MICQSEAVLLTRMDAQLIGGRSGSWRSRLQGVVFAQQYLMLDYDCPIELLGRAPPRSPPAWSRRPCAAGRPELVGGAGDGPPGRGRTR